MNKIYIVLGLIVAVTTTSIFINNYIPKMSSSKVVISETEDMNKILENKDKIVKVTKIYESEGEETEEELSVEEGYNFIKSIKIVKKSSMAVADNSKTYKFVFKDNSVVNIYFEGPYLRYKGENYEVEYQK